MGGQGGQKSWPSQPCNPQTAWKWQVTSLASTLRGGSKKMVKRMWLMHPAVDLSDILPLKAHLDLEVSAKVAANSLLPRTWQRQPRASAGHPRVAQRSQAQIGLRLQV